MDIRELLQSLSPEDRILFYQMRNDFRRVYLNAHNATVTMAKWAEEDDAFLDLMDIKLAVLFDRSGLINSEKDVVGANDASKIENKVIEQGRHVSEGTRKLSMMASAQKGWN